MRRIGSLGLLLAGIVGATAPAGARCIRIETFWSPALFARYPAEPSSGPWRVPDVHRGMAHRYRSMISGYGRAEPDFDGHYRVAPIGCGAGAECPVFIDRINGQAIFSPLLKVASIMPVDLGASRLLTYRRDSRLLVLIGVGNNIERTAGASLFEWRSGGLHLIRFVPERQLCVTGEAR